MGKFCRLHGNTDEPCPECAVFQQELIERLTRELDELRDLLWQCRHAIDIDSSRTPMFMFDPVELMLFIRKIDTALKRGSQS